MSPSNISKKAWPALALLLFALPPGLSAQVKTELRPLTIKAPDGKAEPKYYLHVMAEFGPRGMYLTRVLPGSPLASMRRAGDPGKYIAEAGDRVIAIKDGLGRFVVPQSPAAFASIVNTLPSPDTQVLIDDTRGTGAWVYSVSLKPNGPPPPPPPAAGKIVVVLVGDTNDRSVGPVVKQTLDSLKTVFETETIKKQVREVVLITGADFERQSILDALNRTGVRREDTLLCFVNCHGAHDPKLGAYANGHYFHVGGKVMPRKALHDALVLKGARLTCLISESCNRFHPVSFPLEMTVESKVVSRNPKLESLLLGPRGMADMNSSRPGQLSFAGIFGPMFREAVSEKPNNAWVNVGGKKHPACRRTIPVGRKTTWRAFAEELRSGADDYYRTLRAGALKDPRLDADRKKLIEGQPHQELMVVELPG